MFIHNRLLKSRGDIRLYLLIFTADNKVEGHDFKCDVQASCLKLNNSSTGNCACVCHAGFSGDGHNCTGKQMITDYFLR